MRRVPWLKCRLAPAALAAGLGACGDDPAELAFARCKAEVAKALGAAGKVDFPAPARLALADSEVYGWHLDIDVSRKLDGETRRLGYRCLFAVENRDAPLFLAVVER